MPISTDQPRDNPLLGKTAIVTGAGAAGDGIGNGRATAILLARAGVHALVLDLNGENLAQTRRMAKLEGYDADPRVCDVAGAAHWAAAAAHAVDRWGRIHILVNVVGIKGPRYGD